MVVPLVPAIRSATKAARSRGVKRVPHGGSAHQLALSEDGGPAHGWSLRVTERPSEVCRVGRMVFT